MYPGYISCKDRARLNPSPKWESRVRDTCGFDKSIFKFILSTVLIVGDAETKFSSLIFSSSISFCSVIGLLVRAGRD